MPDNTKLLKSRSRFGPFLRTTSALLIAGFLAQDVLYANPDVKEITVHGPQSIVHSKIVQIPEEMGTVEEVFQSPGTGHQLFLIQDAHVNESAQRNIVKIIDHIIDKEKIKTVFLEAGTGDDSLSDLRPLADAKKRLDVSERFLRKGYIQGPDYLDLNSDKAFQLWGVEDKTLYYEAVRLYRDVAKDRDAANAFVDRIGRALKSLKPRLYSPKLLDFDKKRQAYLENGFTLTDYFKALSEIAAEKHISLLAYPNFLMLKEVQQSESAIDFQKANEEQQAAISSLPIEEQQKLRELLKVSAKGLERARADNTRKLGDFYATLELSLRGGAQRRRSNLAENEIASVPAAPRNDYHELKKYFEYLKAVQKIRHESLLKELEDIEEQVYTALVTTDEERSLVEITSVHEVLDRLVNLKATSSDIRQIKQNPEKFTAIQVGGILNRQFMLMQSHYEDAILLDEKYDTAFEQAKKFYDLTEKRDEVFVRNILDKLQKENQTKAALVVGGYHTENLKKLLREKSISYVSIMPRVLHETNTKKYEQLLLAGLQTGDDRLENVGQSLQMPKNILQAESLKKLINTMPGAQAVFMVNGARLAVRGMLVEELGSPSHQVTKSPVNAGARLAEKENDISQWWRGLFRFSIPLARVWIWVIFRLQSLRVLYILWVGGPHSVSYMLNKPIHYMSLKYFDVRVQRKIFSWIAENHTDQKWAQRAQSRLEFLDRKYFPAKLTSYNVAKGQITSAQEIYRRNPDLGRLLLKHGEESLIDSNVADPLSQPLLLERIRNFGRTLPAGIPMRILVIGPGSAGGFSPMMNEIIWQLPGHKVEYTVIDPSAEVLQAVLNPSFQPYVYPDEALSLISVQKASGASDSEREIASQYVRRTAERYRRLHGRADARALAENTSIDIVHAYSQDIRDFGPGPYDIIVATYVLSKASVNGKVDFVIPRLLKSVRRGGILLLSASDYMSQIARNLNESDIGKVYTANVGPLIRKTGPDFETSIEKESGIAIEVKMAEGDPPECIQIRNMGPAGARMAGKVRRLIPELLQALQIEREEVLEHLGVGLAGHRRPGARLAAATSSAGDLGKRLLIVDNSRLDRARLKGVLMEEYQTIEEADSVEEAMSMIRGNPAYDLVITDLNFSDSFWGMLKTTTIDGQKWRLYRAGEGFALWLSRLVSEGASNAPRKIHLNSKLFDHEFSLKKTLGWIIGFTPTKLEAKLRQQGITVSAKADVLGGKQKPERGNELENRNPAATAGARLANSTDREISMLKNGIEHDVIKFYSKLIAISLTASVVIFLINLRVDFLDHLVSIVALGTIPLSIISDAKYKKQIQVIDEIGNHPKGSFAVVALAEILATHWGPAKRIAAVKALRSIGTDGADLAIRVARSNEKNLKVQQEMIKKSGARLADAGSTFAFKPQFNTYQHKGRRWYLAPIKQDSKDFKDNLNHVFESAGISVIDMDSVLNQNIFSPSLIFVEKPGPGEGLGHLDYHPIGLIFLDSEASIIHMIDFRVPGSTPLLYDLIHKRTELPINIKSLPSQIHILEFEWDGYVVNVVPDEAGARLAETKDPRSTVVNMSLATITMALSSTPFVLLARETQDDLYASIACYIALAGIGLGASTVGVALISSVFSRPHNPVLASSSLDNGHRIFAQLLWRVRVNSNSPFITKAYRFLDEETTFSVSKDGSWHWSLGGLWMEWRSKARLFSFNHPQTGLISVNHVMEDPLVSFSLTDKWRFFRGVQIAATLETETFKKLQAQVHPDLLSGSVSKKGNILYTLSGARLSLNDQLISDVRLILAEGSVSQSQLDDNQFIDALIVLGNSEAWVNGSKNSKKRNLQERLPGIPGRELEQLRELLDNAFTTARYQRLMIQQFGQSIALNHILKFMWDHHIHIEETKDEAKTAPDLEFAEKPAGYPQTIVSGMIYLTPYPLKNDPARYILIQVMGLEAIEHLLNWDADELRLQASDIDQIKSTGYLSLLAGLLYIKRDYFFNNALPEDVLLKQKAVSEQAAAFLTQRNPDGIYKSYAREATRILKPGSKLRAEIERYLFHLEHALARPGRGKDIWDDLSIVFKKNMQKEELTEEDEQVYSYWMASFIEAVKSDDSLPEDALLKDKDISSSALMTFEYHESANEIERMAQEARYATHLVVAMRHAGLFRYSLAPLEIRRALAFERAVLASNRKITQSESESISKELAASLPGNFSEDETAKFLSWHVLIEKAQHKADVGASDLDFEFLPTGNTIKVKLLNPPAGSTNNMHVLSNVKDLVYFASPETNLTASAVSDFLYAQLGTMQVIITADGVIYGLNSRNVLNNGIVRWNMAAHGLSQGDPKYSKTVEWPKELEPRLKRDDESSTNGARLAGIDDSERREIAQAIEPWVKRARGLLRSLNDTLLTNKYRRNVDADGVPASKYQSGLLVASLKRKHPRFNVQPILDAQENLDRFSEGLSRILPQQRSLAAEQLLYFYDQAEHALNKLERFPNKGKAKKKSHFDRYFFDEQYGFGKVIPRFDDPASVKVMFLDGAILTRPIKNGGSFMKNSPYVWDERHGMGRITKIQQIVPSRVVVVFTDGVSTEILSSDLILFISTTQLASLLNIPLQTIQNWIHVGRIHSKKVDGGNKYIPIQDIEVARALSKPGPEMVPLVEAERLVGVKLTEAVKSTGVNRGTKYKYTDRYLPKTQVDRWLKMLALAPANRTQVVDILRTIDRIASEKELSFILKGRSSSSRRIIEAAVSLKKKGYSQYDQNALVAESGIQAKHIRRQYALEPGLNDIIHSVFFLKPSFFDDVQLSGNALDGARLATAAQPMTATETTHRIQLELFSLRHALNKLASRKSDADLQPADDARTIIEHIIWLGKKIVSNEMPKFTNFLAYLQRGNANYRKIMRLYAAAKSELSTKITENGDVQVAPLPVRPAAKATTDSILRPRPLEEIVDARLTRLKPQSLPAKSSFRDQLIDLAKTNQPLQVKALIVEVQGELRALSFEQRDALLRREIGVWQQTKANILSAASSPLFLLADSVTLLMSSEIMKEKLKSGNLTTLNAYRQAILRWELIARRLNEFPVSSDALGSTTAWLASKPSDNVEASTTPREAPATGARLAISKQLGSEVADLLSRLILGVAMAASPAQAQGRVPVLGLISPNSTEVVEFAKMGRNVQIRVPGTLDTFAPLAARPVVQAGISSAEQPDFSGWISAEKAQYESTKQNVLELISQKKIIRDKEILYIHLDILSAQPNENPYFAQYFESMARAVRQLQKDPDLKDFLKNKHFVLVGPENLMNQAKSIVTEKQLLGIFEENVAPNLAREASKVELKPTVGWLAERLDLSAPLEKVTVPIVPYEAGVRPIFRAQFLAALSIGAVRLSDPFIPNEVVSIISSLSHAGRVVKAELGSVLRSETDDMGLVTRYAFKALENVDVNGLLRFLALGARMSEQAA